MIRTTVRQPARGIARSNWIILIAAAGIVIYGYFIVPHARETPFAPAEQRNAFSLEMPDLDGKTWSLAGQRGRVVMVNFWATWCPPCRQETPDLVAVARKYASRGLSAVGVSLDEGRPEAVRAFATRYGIPYPILQPGDSPPVQLHIEGIPVTLLIDRQGRLAKRYDGAVTESQLSADIERLLAEN